MMYHIITKVYHIMYHYHQDMPQECTINITLNNTFKEYL
jgi:hypothetical protein